MNHSNWPDLSEELDGIVLPEGLPDPRDAYCAAFLLGPIRVYLRGQRVAGGWRRKSLELLAYLAVHPLGAAKDQILEALWPEEDPRGTQHRLWQSLSFLRSRLGSPPSSTIVGRTDDLYRLNANMVWVDVAILPGPPLGSSTELRFGCHLYKGEFCEGRYFSWATITRERLRSLFIESSKKHAESLAVEGDLLGAVTTLARAIEADPYDEDLVRQAIRLDLQMGRHDLAARRYRRLRRALVEELDLEPSEQTAQIMRPHTSSGYGLDR